MKAILIAALLLAGCASSPTAWVIEDGAVVADQPLAEYANSWWQWAYSMSPEESAVHDTTGDFCHINQQGDVWYLAGGYGSSKIQRSCVVPAGKHLFFPVINMVYSPGRPGSLTCAQAKRSAALNNETALGLYLEIDGVVMPRESIHRLASPDCFDIAARVPASENPARIYPSASEGYWVMLKPLPPGMHRIAFSAQYSRSARSFGRMVQDIQYDLLVE